VAVKVKVNYKQDRNRPKWRKGGRIYIPTGKMDEGPSWFSIILFVVIIPCWPIAAILGVKKAIALWKQKKIVDYRNYAAVIGDRCEVNVRELASKMGKTPSLVMMDLQEMIGKGYMGENAYLDKGRGVLVLDVTETTFVDEEPEVVVETVQEREEPVREEPAEEPVRARPVRTPKKSVWQEEIFEGTLRQIRELNDRIEDAHVSATIDRLGGLTASIFTVVRQKPEQEDEVRKFMNYYLPTTFKLLESYALMEKQSYQGETIVASRKKIESILETLVKGFEELQDRLFRTDAMDVDAEIRVLETMLASDGLVSGGLDLRAMAAQQGVDLTAGGKG